MKERESCAANASVRARNLRTAIGLCLLNMPLEECQTDEGWSDFFWWKLFSRQDGKIHANQIKRFFIQYGLQRLGPWDHCAVKKALEKWREGQNDCPAQAIDTFARDLRRAFKDKPDAPNDSGKRHKKVGTPRSAASKLAFFAMPDKPFFILDSRTYEACKLTNGTTEKPDYSTFYPKALKRYETELGYNDFCQAQECALKLLRWQEAELKPPREFMQRYFLDKLLFAEGRRPQEKPDALQDI